jgi:multiple sugar transport system substrate-binding protein
MAMDNSVIGTVFPYKPILDQLSQKQFSELNHFTVTGAPGTAPELTTKDLVWGIATGKFSAGDPYVTESVVLLKQLFDSCATKNWSGITGLSGDGVGLPQFESGQAAMTFAVDFGYGTIAASAHFPIGEHALPRDHHGDHRAVGQRPRTLGQQRQRDELHDPGPPEQVPS